MIREKWKIINFPIFTIILVLLLNNFSVSKTLDNIFLAKNSTEFNLNLTISSTTPKNNAKCFAARIKCALRQGCGTALQSYMLDCSDLMAGRVSYCDPFCEASLIALTSTEEGEELMNCECTNDFCQESKERMEVCREKVIRASGKDAVVSCSVAHLICNADTSCGTALNYYDRFCKRMFTGIECNLKCNNSISILKRQDKAAKLETCACDGTESFDCFSIKANMENLCFKPPIDEKSREDETDINDINSITGQNLQPDEDIIHKKITSAVGPTIYKPSTIIKVISLTILSIINYILYGLDVR